MRCSGKLRMGYLLSGTALAVAMLGLMAGSASAYTVLTPAQANLLGSFNYNGYNVVNNTNVTLSGPVGQIGTFGSGRIDLYGTGSNTGQYLATWCLDVFDDLRGSDNYTVTFPPLTNDGGAGRFGLGASVLNPTQLTDVGILVHWGDIHITDDTAYSAATQLAIWDVAYHGTGDTFTSSSTAVNNEVSYLMTNLASLGPAAFLKEVVDPVYNQGLVFEVGTSTSLPTPLPSTWTMLIAGFVGLGFFAYRGTKKNSATLAAA